MENLEYIHGGLRNGLGLTRTLAGLQMDIKEVSADLRKDVPLLAECNRQCVLGFKHLLSITNDEMLKKKPAAAAQNNEFIRTFVSRVNLWEELCNKQGATPANIIKALIMTKNQEEAATVCGMTLHELQDIMINNNLIRKFISSERIQVI